MLSELGKFLAAAGARGLSSSFWIVCGIAVHGAARWLFYFLIREKGVGKMNIINQKLGTVGDVHASIVDGKLVIGVDGELDLVAQLEKLRAAHQADFLGAVIGAAEGGLKALSAAPAPAAAAAPQA